MPDLCDALTRLAKFRQSWNGGDVIDDDSKLTVDDLDVIIANGRAAGHIGEEVERALDA